MSLLRILAVLADAPVRCQWALVDDDREPVAGEGPLAELPRRSKRVQLVIPAAEVLITRAQVPQSARRRAGSVLGYAVEDVTIGDPDAGQVSWLGAGAGADILAVVNREGLGRWLDALEVAGIHAPEVHSETLLLPWVAGEWSLAWDGREGFVRTGKFEGAVTDCGDHGSPPLSLRLMLDEAQARGGTPASIALYITAPDTAPDLEAWQNKLGVAMRPAGAWDWRTAPPEAGINLAQPQRHWRLAPGIAARLRPAAWIAGIALAIQALALLADWTLLAGEQKALRRNMDAQFRATFPDAVAVVDPALQMRRKLAEARHAAGQPDRGDFLPMIEQVAAAATGLPAGTIRALSYEGGRMTLELSAIDEAGIRRIVGSLLQSGLRVDTSMASTQATGATIVLTVRAA